MGDPAGVGPEICLKLLADASSGATCTPIVFGDADLLRRVADQLRLPFDAPSFPLDAWPEVCRRIDAPAVLDLRRVAAGDVVAGRVDASCGDAAFHYVMAAIDAGLAGEVQAIVTGPLNKEALHAAGHKFPGHTEIFAQRLHAKRSCMMLTSERITCSLVTIHVGYHEVPELLSTRRILDVIELTVEAMQRIRGRQPRLAVCGLNPHAGEGGLFGRREEERLIQPAIEAARRQGLQVEGPLPPDTAFVPSRREMTDAYICMYHDQGLIPLKALAFDTAINITLGLPMVRTSVDHGTAFDIAWQGKASPLSLGEAVRLAARLCR
jgi:4-hydroxythreonine-4-phosphate dehydrogenase